MKKRYAHKEGIDLGTSLALKLLFGELITDDVADDYNILAFMFEEMQEIKAAQKNTKNKDKLKKLEKKRLDLRQEIKEFFGQINKGLVSSMYDLESNIDDHELMARIDEEIDEQTEKVLEVLDLMDLDQPSPEIGLGDIASVFSNLLQD